jgi:hypothetical protein
MIKNNWLNDMEKKYYHNKKVEIISVLKATGIAIVCIVILYFINYFTTKWFNYFITPFILAIPILGPIIYTIRTILCFNKPFLILNTDEIKYFNVLGYNTYLQTDIKLVTYDKLHDAINLFAHNGQRLNSISLNGLNNEAITEILDYFKPKIKEDIFLKSV